MRVTIMAIAAVLWAGGTSCKSGATAGREGEKTRHFEMRTYVANEGKMEALHQRFRDHANRLLAKHGVELVGHWTVASGEGAGNTLIFILAYPSREAREASWRAFMEDPEWKKAKEESEKGGVLVGKVIQTFMVPTDYSPIR